MQAFVTQLRVRHYEMDTLGHVNNAVYQHYLEQAAIEHCEYLGLTLDRFRELGGAFVVRKLEIEYLSSAVAGDLLEIKTWAEAMKGTRAVRHYEIRKQGEENLVVKAQAVWVWVEAATMRPRGIPEAVFEAFGYLRKDAISAE